MNSEDTKYSSGVTGEQEAGEPEILAPPKRQTFRGNSLPDTLQNMFEDGQRRLGGHIGGTFLIAKLQEDQNRIGELQGELSETRINLKECNELLTELKVENSRIKTELSSLRDSRHLNNLSMTIGSIILGYTGSTYGEEVELTTIVLTALGALLLLGGWLFQIRRSKHAQR